MERSEVIRDRRGTRENAIVFPAMTMGTSYVNPIGELPRGVDVDLTLEHHVSNRIRQSPIWEPNFTKPKPELR